MTVLRLVLPVIFAPILSRVISVPSIPRAFTPRFAHNVSTQQCEHERAKIRKVSRIPRDASPFFLLPRGRDKSGCRNVSNKNRGQITRTNCAVYFHTDWPPLSSPRITRFFPRKTRRVTTKRGDGMEETRRNAANFAKPRQRDGHAH